MTHIPSLISSIEVIPFASKSPDTDEMDTSSSTVVVRLTDTEGRHGIGEADAPWLAVKAFIEMPTEHSWSQTISKTVIGLDPVEARANWDRLYQATLYPGRRGLGIHALSAIDIAMYDLAGKQLGLPAYKLLGGATRDCLQPYCTIYAGNAHGKASVPALIAAGERQMIKAIELGFTKLKLELLFGPFASDRDLVDIVRGTRKLIGDDISLALDFGYRWHSAADARQTLRRLAEFDIAFAEAVLQHDDLHGHAKLAHDGAIKLCGAEFAATRWEIREWINVGKVDIVQPDVTRSGGLTELMRIADLCEMHGVQVIPHGWKTGILVAASGHFHAAHNSCPSFEFISPEIFPSPLRQNLTTPEPKVNAGTFSLPGAPGIGVELSAGALSEYGQIDIGWSEFSGPSKGILSS